MTTEQTANDNKPKSPRSRRTATQANNVRQITDEQRAKANQALANLLRENATRGQRWTQDTAFNLRLKSGKERGFSDMEDFIDKSITYHEKLIRKRGDRGTAGERRSSRYAFAGAMSRLIPGLLIIIAGILFYPAMLAGLNKLGEGGQHLFVVPTQTPVIPTVVVPPGYAGQPPVYVPPLVSTSDTPDFQPYILPLGILLAVGILYYTVRRMKRAKPTKRRKLRTYGDTSLSADLPLGYVDTSPTDSP